VLLATSANILATYVWDHTGWAKKVIPLVQCNVMYEIFWPILYWRRLQ